jgi:hypothetical protein
VETKLILKYFQGSQGETEDSVEEWDHKSKRWKVSATILNWKRADSRGAIHQCLRIILNSDSKPDS